MDIKELPTVYCSARYPFIELKQNLNDFAQVSPFGRICRMDLTFNLQMAS